MAPTQEEIKNLFYSNFQWESSASFNVQSAGAEKAALIQNLLAPDVKVHVVGQEFQYAADLVGAPAAMEYLSKQYIPGILGAIDTSKPINSEVIRVISTDSSPWAAVEFKNTATTKG